MKVPALHSKDPDLQKAPQALLRAAEKARQLAEQTGYLSFCASLQRMRKSASNAGTASQ